MFAKTMVAPNLKEPPDLASDARKSEEVIWEASLKSFARCTKELLSNLTTLYAVI
jgi:hypothetical protein